MPETLSSHAHSFIQPFEPRGPAVLAPPARSGVVQRGFVRRGTCPGGGLAGPASELPGTALLQKGERVGPEERGWRPGEK